MYGDLVYEAPDLKPDALDRFFKEASFGVPAGQAERTYSPRADVTIVRDRAFGVPHIYGTTRVGAAFGLGYVAAEDRLFFIDVLRHVGRGQLASFAGGAPGNRAFDRTQWAVAPYTEADLQRQTEYRPPGFEADSDLLREDLRNYVAGINQYIAEARLNPAKMPAEYTAINRPQGPEDWKPTDIVATASLVGGIFGKGGGGELGSALVLEQARKRFGPRAGRRVWADFRSAEDPETPTTVHKRSFPYQRPPRKPRGRALPDPGTVKLHQLVPAGEGSAGDPVEARGETLSPVTRSLSGLLSFPSAASNALLISARESRSGRPLAVFGPQTGYFSPQILMEQDVHAPGIDARGAAFPGVNLYVQLGRGRDYAWSATSAGQDNIDTFAVELCEPGGGAATIDSTGYRFRGECKPIEVLERVNSWTPNAADQTPAGSERMRAERTALGLVAARATVRGVPVAYTKLRTTYMHETDSGLGLSLFNQPDRMRNARDFQRAASLIGYTFNWLYVDDRDMAYFNSGANPVRAKGVDPHFPVWGRYEWKRFDPATLTAANTPFKEHPRIVNQRYLSSWNNKQAPGYRAADDNWTFGSVHRVKRLNDRIERGIKGRRKMTLTELVGAMEDAGTVDLRGDAVLPLALRVLRGVRDPEVAAAAAKLRAWSRDGAHRRDRDRSGVYEHSEAIRIMDAWWPLWVEAHFEPALGEELFERIEKMVKLDNAPNNHGDHLGSAYQYGWYGFASKDLRRLLGMKVKGRYSRAYCGRGRLAACRKALADSLKQAAKATAAEVYKDPLCQGGAGSGLDPQWCFDSVRFRPLGGITQPLIHWIDRPTYQQVVEVQGHRPR